MRRVAFLTLRLQARPVFTEFERHNLSLSSISLISIFQDPVLQKTKRLSSLSSS